MAERSVSVRLRAITSEYDSRITRSGRLTDDFANRLERADGRMANLVQTSLALAPALVPIGAAGVPAIAGLTAELGFATLGVGSLVLGLHGVGDTLDALNKFQLEPTADHFQKLTEEVDKLGPAGAEFVLFLDDLSPRLHEIQALAEQGLLPGVEDGLNHALNLLPQVRELVFGISSTVGDLIRDAGDNLDDPRWQEFFAFLQTRARPTLTEMGQTAGNFALSFANLVEAFDPLERDFSRGLLHMSQSVRDWSADLEHTDGFQNFVDYVRENGPKVLDTLAALGDTFVQIVEAAAPVGSLALPVLTDLLKIVGAIADTPVVGSGLIGLAAAIGIYGRSLAVLETVGLRGNGEGILASTFSGARKNITEATAALTQVTTAQDRARLSAGELAAVEERRQATVDRGLTTLKRGAGLAAGFAVAQSGVADSMGLSNTASLALMGTIAGPWGAAIGGGVGLVMDLSHANDDLEQSIKRVDAAADNLDFATMRSGIKDMLAQLEDAKHTSGFGDFISDSLGNLASTFSHGGTGLDLLTDFIPFVGGSDRQHEIDDQIEQRTRTMDRLRQTTTDLYAALRGGDPSTLKLTDDELARFTTQIAPAFQRAGLNVSDVVKNGPIFDPIGWMRGQFAVHEWNLEMDSAGGRSQAVGDALRDLQGDILPTADAAKELADALDALFSPKLDRAQATNRWLEGLHELRDELKGTGRDVFGDSKGALKTQDALIDQTTRLLDKVKADANADASPKKLAKELRDGRDAIIEQAVAAGKSRPQVVKYLNSLGLTARNLNIILDAVVPKVHRISAALAALTNKSYEVKVRTVYEATHSNALGSFNPAGSAPAPFAVAYATGGRQPGDVANRHMPELAGPGGTRVWREPETGGEAYIPLANDFRRPRAVDIWEQTGAALGLAGRTIEIPMRRYAFGGMNGYAGSTSVEIDYDRLGEAVAKHVSATRPLYGDVHISGDPTVFRREMQQDARRSALDGIRR